MSIYHVERKIKSRLNKIRDSKIPKKNKIWIEKFYKELCVRDLERISVLQYLKRSWVLSQWVNKDLDKLDKEDVKEIVKKIEENGYKKVSKNVMKTALKKLLQFVNGFDWDSKEYPECCRWIKVSTTIEEPREVLTKQEVIRMIEGAFNIRDKALISMLYESGARIGEILSLQIKHIEFDKYGCIIRVKGKTGVRRVRLVSSVTYLSQWIQAHPNKDDRESPLWVSMSNRNKHERLAYGTVKGALKRIAKKMGIEKRVNPHSFRHARATHMASKLTEAQMEQYFGWVHGSKMSSVYVHMSGRDMDDAILKMHGIIPEEEKKEEISLRVCPICNERNSTTNDYCRRCGSSLIQENELLKFLSQPDVLDVLVKKLAEQMKK